MQFPHTKEQIYLNHAAISPFSSSVKAAIEQYVAERHGKHIENYYVFQTIIEETYQRIAGLLRCDPERLCLTPNTTTGINILATSYPWQKGDRILLNTQEFPANVYPFLNMQRFGVSVDFIDSNSKPIMLSDIEHALTPETKILSISMVQFLSGQAIDLAEVSRLCHQNDTFLCIDAIQGLGATNIDVTDVGIDFLACGSHKWLMAPTGLGFIYLTKRLQEKLIPSYVGWLGVENAWELFDYDLTFPTSARCFETGTMNHIAIAGLHASLGLLETEGYNRIRQKVRRNSHFFLERFPELQWLTPAEERLGIVTFKHDKAETIYQGLLQRHTTVSLRERHYIRLSPHYYHQETELEKAAQQLAEILDKL